MVGRIRDLCKRDSITVQKLEIALNFANGSINKWDNKRPSVDKVAAVADYFHVSVDYLLTGKKDQPTVTDGLSEDEALLIQLFRSLPEEHRQFVLSQLRAAAPPPAAPVSGQ